MQVQPYSQQSLFSFGTLGPLAPVPGQPETSGIATSLSTQPQEQPPGSADAKTVSKVFADEMLRRIEQNGIEKAEDADGAALADSLARSADFVREKFGDDAATAFMGIIAKHVGEGEINEQNFGEGMLSALRFIDRNFGTDAGDELMAQFNGDLNNTVNDYFDNGQLEKFYAATPEGNAIENTVKAAAGVVADKFGQDAAATVEELVRANMQDSDKFMKGLRKGLKAAREYLAEEFGPGSGGALQGLMGALNSAKPKAGYGPSSPESTGILVDAQV